MTHKHSLKHGFTLVEILVVLAIMTLLAAILLPVVNSVREGARTTTCASNLRQIGTALALYEADNNQRLPLVGHRNGFTWVDTVYPYVKAAGVFVCPSAQHGEYVPGGSPQSPIIMEVSESQYGDNGSYDMVTPFVETQRVGGKIVSTVQEKSLSLMRYRFPSSTILLLDGRDTTYFFHNNYAAVNPGIDPIHSVADLNDGGVIASHKGGVNLLYVDGHVKWHDLESLASTPMWRYDGQEPVATPTTAPTP